jgi:lipid A 4'-phosphatase
MTARHWRAREVEAAAALATLCLAAIVFTAWPRLDLTVSAWFGSAEGRFIGQQMDLVLWVHQIVPWLGRLATLLGVVLMIVYWRRSGTLRRSRWRGIVALTLLMLVGVGVLVNAVLKEHWGRARPVAVAEFGGPAQYTPPLQITDQCDRNCSFVSGHASTGFALLAVGLLGASRTRRRWLVIGGVAGALVGLGRMLQGGHFLADVVFAGALLWVSACGLRYLWLLHAARNRRNRRRLPAPSPGAVRPTLEA